jgi:predicted alpha/beta superfamily hydrolase
MKLIWISILLLELATGRAYCQGNNSKITGSSKPFVLGVIDELQPGIMPEKRVLNIYLPEGYNQNDTIKYPVVYLLDGSADEDFIHVAGLYQFNSFSWINRVPKSIIVGIANVDRKRDFTFPTHVPADKDKNKTSGKSGNFISFLEKELKPFIEKKYKADSTSTIIGQSLGGLLATEILFTRPSLFSKYIIISPSLWWDNGSLLNYNSEPLRENFNHKIDVYIGVGKEGLTPGDQPRVMEVDANLLAEKLKGLNSRLVTTHFDYLPQENHATIAHQAIFDALRLLYPGPTK